MPPQDKGQPRLLLPLYKPRRRLDVRFASEPGSWWPAVGKPTGMDCVHRTNQSGGVEGNFLPKFTRGRREHVFPYCPSSSIVASFSNRGYGDIFSLELNIPAIQSLPSRPQLPVKCFSKTFLLPLLNLDFIWTMEVMCKAFGVMSVWWILPLEEIVLWCFKPAVTVQMYSCTMSDIINVSKNLVPRMRLKTQFELLKRKTFILDVCIHIFWLFFFSFLKDMFAPKFTPSLVLLNKMKILATTPPSPGPEHSVGGLWQYWFMLLSWVRSIWKLDGRPPGYFPMCVGGSANATSPNCC